MQTIGLLSTTYWCCYAFTHLQLLLGIICGCQGRRKTNLNFVLFKLLLTWYCVRARKGTQVCWWEQWKGEVHWWELGSGRNKTTWLYWIGNETIQYHGWKTKSSSSFSLLFWFEKLDQWTSPFQISFHWFDDWQTPNNQRGQQNIWTKQKSSAQGSVQPTAYKKKILLFVILIFLVQLGKWHFDLWREVYYIVFKKVF